MVGGAMVRCFSTEYLGCGSALVEPAMQEDNHFAPTYQHFAEGPIRVNKICFGLYS